MRFLAASISALRESGTSFSASSSRTCDSLGGIPPAGSERTLYVGKTDTPEKAVDEKLGKE